MSAPTKIELIDRAWAAVEADGPYDFARKVGLGDLGYQKWYRWTKQNGRLDYEDAWKLLQALGWIRQEPALIDELEDYVKRLDGGEQVPARERERVAKQADRLSANAAALAARIREGARADHKAR